MIEPQSELTLYAGIYCKRYTLREGTAVPQHVHDYDHLTYIVSGAVRLLRGEQSLPMGDYYAPVAIQIPARTKHTFVALKPTTLLCLHNMDHAETF